MGSAFTAVLIRTTSRPVNITSNRVSFSSFMLCVEDDQEGAKRTTDRAFDNPATITARTAEAVGIVRNNVLKLAPPTCGEPLKDVRIGGVGSTDFVCFFHVPIIP